MIRRSFIKWMTAAGATLLLPYSTRPTSTVEWKYCKPITFWWENLYVEGGVVDVDVKNAEGRWQPFVTNVEQDAKNSITVESPYVKDRGDIRVTNHRLHKALISEYPKTIVSGYD